MAEEKQSKNNINQDINTANAGLNLDSSINQVKSGSLTYALNAAVENFDGNVVNYQNEMGNDLCITFPKSYLLIGTHFINEKSKHIFFLVNPLTSMSQIGYMDNNDCIYHVLVESACLNFNIDNPIHKVVHKITNCTTEIYWTDGFNPRRWLDINNIPWKLLEDSTLCDPKYDVGNLDCNQLKIQPNFTIPQLKVVKIVSGGSLISGTYQFGIQYCDASGNPYTSYYSITNPTPIIDEQLTTVNFNTIVNKSIVVDIADLDTSGQFQYYNLAVIKTVNNTSSVELVGTYFIERDTDQVTYTGDDQSPIQLTIADIFEKFPYYEVAQDLTAVQDILVWDNLTSISRINYQEIANKINVQWETYRIPATENYADELNATNLRGYLRDEVYAFEIVFLLKNGKQTDGFHIPGRVKTFNELSQPDIPTSSADFIGEPEPGTLFSPYWKIYNTASVIGTSPGYSSDPSYKGPYQYGEMAYWESIETYPCNQALWGELAGQPIRHHKFPDVLISPITESKIFSSASGMVMGNDAVFPIGLKIDVGQISYLIYNSNLTDDEKSEIAGFKIIRGNRGVHKSIIAKGILRNVNSYEREGQYYYYPNYPYNEIGPDPDPFLNETNNAWTELCEPWEVEIVEFNMPETGIPTYIEVEYTSCNSNKTSRITYDTLGKHTLCSIGRPKFLGKGPFNRMATHNDGSPETIVDGTKAVVSPMNYDVWDVTIGYDDFGIRKSGYTVRWEDTVEGTKETWVGSFWNNVHYRLNCLKGTTPINISTGDGKGNDVMDGPVEVRVDPLCKEEKPQLAISTKPELAYRQIFNSPETSFGQPYLGDILKLENVIFGAGKAHFVEVKSNARYKLLTEEAQRDALRSAEIVGSHSVGFNATAMFTVYQAYLTIYINGITRKNYAYSYNSIGDYNYSAGIGNNITVNGVTGIKQRMLDINRYLIPGVESVGDTIVVNNVTKNAPINNYRRESSVYLRTDVTKPALPFPSNSPSMIVGGSPIVTDKSRITIGGSGSCSSPAKDQDISVVSYYASLKNIVLNQWGQIYTYTTVDTGFQSPINSKTSGSQTVFGGDTFIGRFAFKTKLPFFIDNRVNAPDDSDIFYDEIGNIAYPKFWHSARSILKDYTVPTVGTLSSIISYKAHNFDCPNSQEPGPTNADGSIPTVIYPAQQNPNRTFYDGYFYLFAYGIPNFYCESSYNLDLRQAFNNKEGDFWPHVSTYIPDDWVQENFVSIAYDNTYNYNVTYSKQNKENTFSHLPADWTKDFCFTYYPFRTIYSDSQNIDADNRVNSWLTYRSVSYFDFPQNYGNLISLDGIQNKAILARFENKSLLYNTLLTIDTSNPQAAYMGNPTLFRSSPPIDFAETDLGYVGSQNKFLLKIPQGQITVDAKRGQIFLITGEGAKDLTSFSSGMNNFFTNHLAFEILKYFPNVDVDNHFNGIGLHGVYDARYERIIITKLDYIPIDSNVKYDALTKQFYIEKNVGTSSIRVDITLGDTDYFCNKSWSVSYNFNTQSWISFHSYIPNFYIGENNFFYSGLNGCCDEFDFVAGTIVPNPPTTTTTSTTAGITTTTSSTTVMALRCNLQGTITLTECLLRGTGVITERPAPAPCVRPIGLTENLFATGYTIASVPTTIDSTGSALDACAAIGYVSNVPQNTTVNTITISYASLNIGSTIYAGAPTETNCTVVPDGWYFTDESASNSMVYNVVNGFITQMEVCCATTTDTTTIAPTIAECCGILFAQADGKVYYLDAQQGNFTELSIPSFSTTYGITMTNQYLWSFTTDILLWDIYLSPFYAVYNRAITLPMGYSVTGGFVAKDNDTLIVANASSSPVNIVELDVTGTAATDTVMFALAADRDNVSNMLYTTDDKLIMISQDVMTSDYYITQYDYLLETIEFDINIGTDAPTSLYECECNIYITYSDGTIWMMEKNTYTLIELETLDFSPVSAAQVPTCVNSSLTNITTTTTTTVP
jgi:hypothetical protein